MYKDVGLQVPHVIQRLHVTKINKGNKLWGYSIKVYSYDLKGVYNIPHEFIPQDVLQVLSLIKVRTERITTQQDGTLTLNGEPFKIFENEELYVPVFRFILLFGVAFWQVTGMQEGIRNGVRMTLESIKLSGSRKIAYVQIESVRKQDITDFVNNVYNEEGDMKIQYNDQASHYVHARIAIPFSTFLAVVYKYNYLLNVPAVVPVVKETAAGVQNSRLSTHMVGEMLLSIDAGKVHVADEAYKWFGGGKAWGLLFEQLRLNNCLAYID